jgi:signal transduction histidine kinase
MRISIKTKISFTYTIVFAVVMFFTGVYIYRAVSDNMIQSALNKISLSVSSNNNIFYQDPRMESMEESLPRYSNYIINSYARRSGMAALLYDNTGRLLEKSGDSFFYLPEKTKGEFLISSLEGNNSYAILGNYIYFSVPLRNNSTVLGTILFIYELKEEYKMLTFLSNSFKLAGLISIIIIICLNLYLSSIITAPLKNLTEAAKSFSSGKSVKIESRSKDELGILTDTFNKMSLAVSEQIKELDNEKSKLDTILSALKEGVAAFDSEGNIIFNNIAFKAMAGTELLEVIRETLHEYTGTSPQIKEIRHNGRIYKLVCVLNNNLFIIVMNDITMDREIIENQKIFVSNASHELKTPVTAILGYVQYLKDTKEYDDIILGNILNQTERLRNLVFELLELSRLDDYNYKLQIKTTNLSDLLEAIIENMQFKARKYNIRILCSLEKDIITLLDPEKITQAFVNIIDNSIKYSRPGSDVEVTLFKRSDNVIASIKDKGIGIPEEEKDRIFDRFYRCNNGLTAGGSGLGLSITKDVIERHGGSLKVESRLNKGSIFTIFFPSAS